MALTAIFALVMICLILAFAHKLSGLGPVKLLVALYLMPEAAALAFYPNSAVFVLTFFIGGLLFTLYRRVWVACALFCVAPLFRLDILYMYPIIVLLNVYVFGLCRRSVFVSLIDALLVGVVTYAGYYLFHADILYTLSEFDRWSDIIPLLKNLIANIGFYTILNFILVPVGLFLLYRRGKRSVFWIIVSALVTAHFVNRDFANASKHYCYLLPFVVIAIGAVMDWLWSMRNSRKWLTVCATVVIILFNIVSVSVVLNPDQADDYNGLKKYRFVKEFYDIDFWGYRFEIGLGGGRDVNTADEIILLTGNFFYPSFIHNVKENDGQNAKVIRKFVENLEEEVKICHSGWENSQRLYWAYFSLTPDQQSKVDLLSFCEEVPNYKMTVPYLLAGYRSALSAYADHYPDKKIYVCSPTSICYKTSGLLKLLEKEGVLVEVGKEIYLYQGAGGE